MPSINRIRVNNVKYNFGTQQYDDFTMRMYGKNTLYDLANGGGKSILMLLLLQNLIPNCTLDEKQPIEKLFRTGGGNTTIHSLIEWKLDTPELYEGYRYMTTGFCARKAKDSPDEEEGGKEIAAVEYFNYCIFYREFNDNDIINLPLVKNGERVGYTAWKNYLKELGRRDLKLEVHVFDRKGEYQRFISRYGLYESHWELIRGINKTEGHVRTYFESNYKTARKVVEDLLIEEIIEKAYFVKVDQNDTSDDMAHTLLEIKDKLVELSKKKREIADYDHQTELLHVLEARVAAFLELYETQSKQRADIADVCVTGATIAKNSEDQMKELERQKEEQLTQINQRRRMQESLKIKRDEQKLVHILEEIQALQEDIAKEEAAMDLCRQEFNRKESMNDYLDYQKDKALKEEHEAMIEASLEQNADHLGQLQALAAWKKKRDDAAMEELRAALQQENKQFEEAQKQVELLEKLERETDISAAVAAHEYQQLEERYQSEIQEIQKWQNKLIHPSFRDPEEMLQEQTDRKTIGKEELDRLEQQMFELQQKYLKEQQDLHTLRLGLSEKESEWEKLDANSRNYRKQAETLKKMLDIYGNGSEGKAVSSLTNEDLSVLLQRIHERHVANMARIAAQKETVKAKQERLQQLTEGRLIAPTEAAEKAKHYIESRHGMDAVFGMDYLTTLSEEERSRLLEAHPLLPYGLLVEDFDALYADEKLREFNLGDGFLPIYNMALLKTVRTESNNDCVMYLQRGRHAFISAASLKQEQERQAREVQDCMTELERLEEMNATYEEDNAFVSAFQGMAILDVEQEQLRLQNEIREQKAEVQEKAEQLDNIRRELDETRGQFAKKQQDVYQILEESGILEWLATCSRQLEKDDEERRSAKQNCDRLESLRHRYQQELHQWKRTSADSGRRLKALHAQADEKLADWNRLYKEFFRLEDVDKEEADLLSAAGLDGAALTDSELNARFKAVKSVFEQHTMVLDDKKDLIAALKTSMERMQKAIEKRGSSLEELEALWKEHKLYPVEEKDLESLSTELSRLALLVDTLTHPMDEKKRQANRLEGSIEQAKMTLEERFGPYEDPAVPEEETDMLLTEGETMLQHLEEAYKDSEQRYRQYSSEYTAMLELYKDVKRIVETNAISLQNAKTLLVGREQLREVFENSLLAYDKSTKALDRAKNELQRYKGRTAQALTEIQAFELSQTISHEVEIPENYGEAKQLCENLSSIINVIALEKERVQQGIEDMQFMKANFEKQCIQRCQDVKNELEKLPKLSRIILDGEPIQMIGLKIPYVKEEFIPQRMSDYIDAVVNGADHLQNHNERMKYIRSRLELKKLFSVIVTDMNTIRLTLYKRERIKEQSRYLRYEEAVGSTGQSQGIYIQFLISIIHYISGIYAPNGETEKRMKTIFIDNPFGAAKDVYIWEPIFELLKTNHVQLIVPARGATPAITARFDVNYVLGQRMVGKRQQTVVMDYRSQVEQEEIEYRNLEYEQVSFDFI